MFVAGKMKLFLQVPGSSQYGRSPISDLLNAGKPGRMGEHVGEKNIAAIEEGKNVPVLMVFFAHSFNDSLSMNEWKNRCVTILDSCFIHLHHRSLLGWRGSVSSSSFKAPGDVFKSPALGLWHFEEGEDKEDDQENKEDEEDIGAT